MKAHDVRQLRVCAHCQHIGDGRQMLNLGGQLYHGSCVLAGWTMEGVLALPQSETDKLTLADFMSVPYGRELIDALLERH
jgi:hypothetical protein